MTDYRPHTYTDTPDVRTIARRYGVTEDDVRLAAHVSGVPVSERPRWTLDADPSRWQMVEDRLRELHYDPSGGDMFLDVTTVGGLAVPYATRDEYGIIAFYHERDGRLRRDYLYGAGIKTARKMRIEDAGGERMDTAALAALPVGAVVVAVTWDEARGDDPDEQLEADLGMHLGGGVYAVWNGYLWSGLRREYARPHAASPARLVEVCAWKSE